MNQLKAIGAPVTMTSREIGRIGAVAQADLLRLISYDPDTGIFRRRVTTSSRAVEGEACGSIKVNASGKAYLAFNVAGQHGAAHRWAFLYMTGTVPDQVDHDNGNGSDNRWSNLKASTNVLNCQNQRLRATNTSGQMGVSWHAKTRQWAIQINVDGRRVHLGYRRRLDDAIAVRKSAEKRHGYSSNHGCDRPLYTAEQVGEWAKHQIRTGEVASA